MHKDWKEEQLMKIIAHTSIFEYIPEEIGNILYCDTNQPMTVPLNGKEVMYKKIIPISISSIILLLYWFSLYEHYIMGTIISIIAIFITIWMCDTTFRGTDYFIGDKGFATVSFLDSRQNITSTKIYLFKDIEYFFTRETINMKNFMYRDTYYCFSLYGKANKNIFFTSGNYYDKHPTDPMNPNWADEEYCMMKMAEKIWTSYFVLEHSQDEKINFGILNNKKLHSDALSISRNEINVYGTIYNPSNTKRIYTSNGYLVIEHINHSKKFFGLVEKGNISRIPLLSLGNRLAFLTFFDRLYKSNR